MDPKEEQQGGRLGDLKLFAPSMAEFLRTTRRALGEAETVSDHTEHPVPHPDEITLRLSPARLSSLADTYYRGRALPALELARNVLVLLPVMFTWLSLSLSSAAFQANVTEFPATPEQPGATLQQLWERGFDVTTVDWGLLKGVPLRVRLRDGGEWAWFTFSFVAGLDALLVLTLAVVVILSAALQRTVARARSNVLDAVDLEATSLRIRARVLAETRQERKHDRRASNLVSAIGGFSTGTEAIISQLTESTSIFTRAAETRVQMSDQLTKAAAEMTVSATAMSSFARQSGALQSQQAETVASMKGTLTLLLDAQEKSSSQLTSVADGIVRAISEMTGTSRQFAEIIGPLGLLAPALTAQAEQIATLDSRIRQLADDIRVIATSAHWSGTQMQAAMIRIEELAGALASSAVNTASAVLEAVSPVASTMSAVSATMIETRDLIQTSMSDVNRRDSARLETMQKASLALDMQVESTGALLSAAVERANTALESSRAQVSTMLVAEQELVDSMRHVARELRDAQWITRQP